MFRNETEEVTRKVKAKGLRRNKVSSSSFATSSPDAVSTTTEGNTESPIELELVRYQDVAACTPSAYSYILSPTVDERGIGFFFANYVIGMDSPSTARLDQNPALSSPGIDENLLTSMKAVGLAGFASSAHAPGLMREAKKQYLAAIQLTNTALRSPVDVKKDSTLLAVMILSIFETISGGNRHSLTAWKSHLNGAAALLKLRGPEQLSTSGGRRMFMQVTSSLVVICLQYDIELPAHIMELRAEAAKHLNPDGLVLRVQEPMILSTNFRARVRHGIISDPYLILARAMELDGNFVSIFSDVPPAWGYKTVYTDADPEIVFSGFYHVYRDFMTAQLWNGMRSFRILLNEMIRDVLLAGFSSRPPRFFGQEYVTQFQISTEALYQLQSDILASVPQHLGYTSKGHKVSSLSGARVSADNDRSPHRLLWSDFGHHRHWDSQGPASVSSYLPVIRQSGGYLLPWPLYLAGATDIATEPVQRWVIESLRSLGRSVGIQQAMVLANMLEMKMNIRFRHAQ